MPRRVTVAGLREKLGTMPDDAEVVLYDEREHVITCVIDHLTFDKRSNAVVLHLEMPGDVGVPRG